MEMMGFDASPPDPVVTNLGQDQAPKKNKGMGERLLRDLIIFFVPLVIVTLVFGVLHLFSAEGPNSLHDALHRHKYDEAIELIRLGGDMNAMNADGKLPLVLAADDSSADAYDVVRELILAGAQVNEADGESYTALHKAAYCGNLAVVDLLLRHGADINAVRVFKNVLGEFTDTPLELAYRQGKFRVAEFLTARGADIPDNMDRLKHAGEAERLREHYRKYPKPPNYTEKEWSKEVARRVFRKSHPEAAPVVEEFMRLNPDLMQTFENIFTEPAPEGVSQSEWRDQQFQRILLLSHSGQLKSPPELKK